MYFPRLWESQQNWKCKGTTPDRQSALEKPITLRVIFQSWITGGIKYWVVSLFKKYSTYLLLPGQLWAPVVSSPNPLEQSTHHSIPLAIHFPALLSTGSQSCNMEVSHSLQLLQWSIKLLQSTVTTVKHQATTVYSYYSEASSYYSLQLLQWSIKYKIKEQVHATVKHLWNKSKLREQVHATVKPKWKQAQVTRNKLRPIPTDHIWELLWTLFGNISYCVHTLQVEYSLPYNAPCTLRWRLPYTTVYPTGRVQSTLQRSLYPTLTSTLHYSLPYRSSTVYPTTLPVPYADVYPTLQSTLQVEYSLPYNCSLYPTLTSTLHYSSYPTGRVQSTLQRSLYPTLTRGPEMMSYCHPVGRVKLAPRADKESCSPPVLQSVWEWGKVKTRKTQDWGDKELSPPWSMGWQSGQWDRSWGWSVSSLWCTARSGEPPWDSRRRRTLWANAARRYTLQMHLCRQFIREHHT